MAQSANLLTSKDVERFWAKVDTSGKCWLWTAHKNIRNHYGQFSLNGEIWLAHRVAWLFANGDIPDGLYVLHSCDNPPCVRESHLFLGTQLDNKADERAKGRTLVGSRNINAKLNEDAVRTMRAMRAAGLTFNVIAKQFQVSPSVAYRAVSGDTWRHI